MAGQTAVRSLISAVTKAVKCQVTTIAVHGLATGNSVRITDLGNMMIPLLGVSQKRGMVQIDGGEYLIEVDSTTTFLLKDPTSMDYIDSTDFQTYVSGGRVNLESTIFLWSAT